MTYRIKKITFKKIECIKCLNEHIQPQLIVNTKYYAERKGIIFGFWHIVGLEKIGSLGQPFIDTEYFTYKEDCKEFIKQFHYLHYGINVNFKIIDKTED